MGVTAEKDERVAIIEKDLLAYIEAVEDIRRRIDISIAAQINLRKMLGLNEKPKSVVNLDDADQDAVDDESEAGAVTTTKEWWSKMLNDVMARPEAEHSASAAPEEWKHKEADEKIDATRIADIQTRNNAARTLRCWKKLD